MLIAIWLANGNLSCAFVLDSLLHDTPYLLFDNTWYNVALFARGIVATSSCLRGVLPLHCNIVVSVRK